MTAKKFPAPIVYGLDIGTRSVVGTVGYAQGKKFTVVAMETVEHETRAMMDGQIHDIALVADTISRVTASLEKKLKLKLDKVCIAAAGRVLKTASSHSDYNFDSERIVTGEDIYTLNSMAVEDAYKKFLEENNNDVKFYCVGSNPIRYYLNNSVITNLAEHKATSIGMDIIATFLPDDVVDSLYRAVNMAGLEVASLTLEPIAAINLAIPEKFRLLNIALVDVGAGTTDISVTREGSVVAFGMIPKAGDRITERIANICMADFNTAEIIKKEISNSDKVKYTDIMGTELTVSSKEIEEGVKEVVDELASVAADKIIEINGGKPVGAVFVVGGGGIYKGYTHILAERLGLPESRVALRGKEVMNDINFADSSISPDSMYVTPIGIALSYYDETNNFIFVNLNEQQIKVYNSNKLTVMDVAMQSDFPADGLFPKSGKAVNYSVNGVNRSARGTIGEPAQIYINGEPANMHSAVKEHDIIKIVESTEGESAHPRLDSVPEFKSTITVNVGGKKVDFPRFVTVNGNSVDDGYIISDSDRIEFEDSFSVKQVKELMNISIPEESECMVNDQPANDDTKVYDGYSLEWITGAVDTIYVTVNGKVTALTGKNGYVFVDIFDFFEFDLSSPKGNIMTKLNGRNAAYMEEIHDGDVIDVFWE